MEATTTPTPYTCKDCGDLVTDHVLSDEVIAKYHVLCEACFEAKNEDDEDEDDEGCERDYDDAYFEDRADLNCWKAEQALEARIDAARGY